MFSQASFRPLSDLPPQRPVSAYSTNSHPSPSSALQTPENTSGRNSPLAEEDAFDLDDPHFNAKSRSRTSSIRSIGRPDRPKEHRSSTAGGVATFVKPEDIGGLLKSLSRSEERHHHFSEPTIQAPTALPALTHHQSQPPSPHKSKSPGGRERMAGFSKSFSDEASGLSPSSAAKSSKLSPSPARHHGLNALSPLQAFSPLQTLPLPVKDKSQSSGTDSPKTHTRSSSLTRSLSRRQSLIANAEKWGRGEEEENRGDIGSLFSRITLVKAPAEETTLKRARSSSSITPFSGRILDADAAATTARGPRRSFAASSFAGFSPIANTRSLKSLPQPFSPHIDDSTNRISYSGSNALGIQRKTMSPEEVFDIARSLASPVAIPEGGFKGAELKRRKSMGASGRRGTNDMTSPEKPPLALEPVEYVQMEDDTLLPFVDRPAEVADLINHGSNEKLFKLLKAAFPKEPLRQHWKALGPEEWNWDEFISHLASLSRAECPDYAWIFRARQAVRARSVALWEKLGVCLGCDGDLLNAGGEDGLPASWGGLGLGDDDDYDPMNTHVWIEGLEAVDPDEQSRAMRQLNDAFGEIVEDEGEQASAGMTALLGAIGEGEEEEPSGGGQTTAQREASRKLNPVDPMTSPSFATSPLIRHDHPVFAESFASSYGTNGHSPFTPKSPGKVDSNKPVRSRSFVGLQILTSPTQAQGSFPKSPTSYTSMNQASMRGYDRDQGNPLFPSSFGGLSVQPNLGREASVGIGGGVKAADEGFGRGSRWGLRRKQSGAGLSESAITFASESDYSHDHEVHA